MNRTHIDVKTFQCEKCNDTFAVQKLLNIHVRKSHDKSRPYECTQCFKTFNFEHKLNQHISKEHEQKNCESCPYCGKQFVWLKLHVASCTKKWMNSERPTFDCPNCNSSFLRLESLRIHVQTGICLTASSIIGSGTGSRYFQTNVSPPKDHEGKRKKIFESQKELSLYFRKKYLKAKQLECTKCSKTFNLEKNLNKHFSKVHEKNENVSLTKSGLDKEESDIEMETEKDSI